MKIKVYVPDIECGSCVKVIGKRFKEVKGITSFIINEDHVDVTYDEAVINPESIMDIIRNAGFRASTTQFERKTFGERVREFRENKAKYAIERRGITYGIVVLILLVVIELLVYNAFLKDAAGMLAKYGWWVFYLDIAVVALGVGIWHILSYKAKVSCMVGMMIGMTIGMQSGLMIGAVIGATNGFFTGALVGMLIGVIIGGWMGKCCGIMGLMEGMMAGVMGGTMGPMISIMMAFDNILWFMPIFMAINIIIICGLSYVMFEEVIENGKDVKKKPIDFVTFASACMIVAALLMIVMVYGPKGAVLI